MSWLYLRPALESELPLLAELNIASFGPSPFNQAMFPESRRVKPGTGDQVDWFLRSMMPTLTKPGIHLLAAVERSPQCEEKIVGFAMWITPKVKKGNENNTEKLANGDEKPKRDLPSYLGVEAVNAANEEIAQLIKSPEVQASMRGRVTDDMWSEFIALKVWTGVDFVAMTVVCVDPNQRRKGIGRLLAQWGVDMAKRNEQDIWLIASPDGSKLYTSMGFEKIAEGSRCGESQTIFVKWHD